MEEKEKANTGMVRHLVGNNMGSAKGNYAFYRTQNKELPEELVRKINELKEEAIVRLDKWLEEEGTKDEGMLKFMEGLRASDWSTEESLLAFKRDVYDLFVTPLEGGARELRNEIFGEPGKGLK